MSCESPPFWLQIKQFIFWPFVFSCLCQHFPPASGGQSGPKRPLFLFGATNWQEATSPKHKSLTEVKLLLQMWQEKPRSKFPVADLTDVCCVGFAEISRVFRKLPRLQQNTQNTNINKFPPAAARKGGPHFSGFIQMLEQTQLSDNLILFPPL